MALHTDDMSKVQKWGDVAVEGWYHVRIEKVEEKESKSTPGEMVVYLYMKVQNEPYIGKLIMDLPSLQSHALAKLKAYYQACNYEPGPEGHDPEQLKGRECYVLVQHDLYQGETRAKVPPFGIKSMQEGPAGAMAK